MDVHNAFLYRDLHGEIYIKLSPNFHTFDPLKLCRLNKSLYGLRQAPHCWFSKLTSFCQCGFVQSYADYSLFTFRKHTVFLCILIYVDDLLISGNDSSYISRFKSYLGSCFHLKDLGNLKYFLGIEIAQSNEGFYLSQRKYALELISEVGLLGPKPVSIPIEPNHQLAKASWDFLLQPDGYHHLIDKLIYLSITRPGLAYTMHIIAQFMQYPHQAHWDAALRVIRYLKGTQGQGIPLRAHTPLRLVAYCDADQASCLLTRCSLT